MSSADETDQSSEQWATPRASLHDRIVAAHFAGKKPSQEGRLAAYFTAGGGASGRTEAVFDVGGNEMTAAQLANPLTAIPEVVVVDPDRIKKLIPDFQLLRDAGDQYAALGVRAEAGAIARRIVAEAESRRLSYLCYTTGSSPSFLEHIAAVKADGYETQVTMMSRPTNEAIVCSMQRGDRSATDRGRYAHIGELKDAHAGASRNLALLQDASCVDRWRVYDTSVPGRVDESVASESVPGFYIDVDSDDSFLGLPVPRYQGRTLKQDAAAVEELLNADQSHEEQLPTLPPLTDDA